MYDTRDELDSSGIQELLEFAKMLASQSRSIILSEDPIKVDIRYKPDDAGPVTKLDIRIEEEWTERIRKQYPAHGIVGEETGFKPGECDFAWILDPIDGTDDLVRSSPLYGSIIAVLYPAFPGFTLPIGAGCFS